MRQYFILLTYFFIFCSYFSGQRYAKNSQRNYYGYLSTVKLAKENLVDLISIHSNMSMDVRSLANDTLKEINEGMTPKSDIFKWLGDYNLERINVNVYEALHEATELLIAQYRKEKKTVQIMELYVRHLKIEDEFTNNYEEDELKPYDEKIRKIRFIKKYCGNLIKGLEKLQNTITEAMAKSVAEDVNPDSPEYDELRNHVTEIRDYLIKLRKNNTVRILSLVVLKELTNFLQSS